MSIDTVQDLKLDTIYERSIGIIGTQVLVEEMPRRESKGEINQ